MQPSLLSCFKLHFQVFLCLLSCLNKTDFLFNGQYGFRGASNTTTAVLHLTSDIQTHIDKNFTCGVSLYLQNVFDTVNHNILLTKLEILWIGRCLYPLYMDSTQQAVICGVPQEAVLGPILFLIYVNSIAQLRLIGAANIYRTIFYTYLKILSLKL